MVALGFDHAIALRNDGTVVSWGADHSGQLGSGRSLAATTAVVVPGIPAAKSIAAGLRHSIAVAQDGTVRTWGMNYYGQLGDGTTVDRSSPIQVAGIADAVSACGSEVHTAVVRQDGSVWSWGFNFYGELGVGTQEESLTPVRALGLANITAIACGHNHVVALRQDGTVWAWGLNQNAELGDGSTTDRWQAVQVPGLANVTAVVAGNGFSAALKQDGSVWEWGRDATDATPPRPLRRFPVQTAGITGAVKLAGTHGSSQLIAIKADGVTWWAWFPGTTPETQAAAGSLLNAVPAYSHTLLLKTDRGVLAFGDNSFGQLGDGTLLYRNEPAPVIGLANIVTIAPSNFFSLALDAGGKVWAWGDDTFGQLGRGGVLNRSIPGEIAGLGNIVQVSAGANHNLAVDQGGSVWAWGEGGYSQLGDGTYFSRSAPIRLGVLTDIQAVAAGAFHSVALKRDGTVWAWGNGTYGQIGNGADDDHPTPVQVPGLNGVVAIAASTHTLALKQDGTVWAWGANDSGALGLGNTANSNVPVQVPGLSGVRTVAATGFRSFAVQADGSVLAWGNNVNGELGDGTTIERHSPVAVTGLTGVVEIAAGVQHTLARRSDGSVWGWGYDSAGELAYNPGNGITTAAPLAGANAIQQIAAGALTSGMLRNDGLVVMGGKNSGGQLGDGTFALHSAFVLTVNSGANGFLNLSGGPTGTVPAGFTVPFFAVAAGGITATSASVSTTTRFNAGDVGKAGAVFVTARVPAGSVAALQSLASPGGVAVPIQPAANDGAYVLLQLTPSGWQQVVNGQLIPYASGVLGDQLAAQTILNGTDTSNLKGAQYCLGYGTSAAEMIATGKMRVVATIPTDPGTAGTTTVSCLVVAPQAGWWWNPRESGRGFSIEVSGSNLAMATFLYDASGRSTWYLSAGPLNADGSYHGPLSEFTGGQTLTGSYTAPAVKGNVSDVDLNCLTSTRCTLNWSGGTVPIERFVWDENAPAASAPETGWWWNAEESGRGYFLEMQGNTLGATAYMYDNTGNALWYLLSAAGSGSTVQSQWSQFANGQTLAGGYVEPVVANDNVGPVTIQFASPTHANLTLPDGRQIPIERFRF